MSQSLAIFLKGDLNFLRLLEIQCSREYIVKEIPGVFLIQVVSEPTREDIPLDLSLSLKSMLMR